MDNKIEAIILAAGKGTRAAEITNGLPKCLIEIGGVPILFGQVSSLEAAGIRTIKIVVGYRQDIVRQRLGEAFPHLDIEYVENPEYARSNTLWSLALALGGVRADTILQLNGDVVFDAAFLKGFVSVAPSSRLAVRAGQCGDEEMKVRINEHGAITAVNKMVPSHAAIGEAIGINMFSGEFLTRLRAALSLLAPVSRQEYFEYALEKVIDEGVSLLPYPLEPHRAIEVDFPEDVERAREMFFAL